MNFGYSVHVRDGVAPLRHTRMLDKLQPQPTVHVRDGVAPLRHIEVVRKVICSIRPRQRWRGSIATIFGPLISGSAPSTPSTSEMAWLHCDSVWCGKRGTSTHSTVHVRDGVAPLRLEYLHNTLRVQKSVHVRDGVAPLRLCVYQYLHRIIHPSTSEMAWLHCDIWFVFKKYLIAIRPTVICKVQMGCRVGRA